VYNGACANCLSSSAAANVVNFQRGSFNPQTSYGGSLDVVLPPRVLVSTRINYFWDNYKDTGIPISPVSVTDASGGTLVPADLQTAAFRTPENIHGRPRPDLSRHGTV
jgi:hypothetical protein